MISRLSSLHSSWRLAGCAAAAISAVLVLTSAGSAKAATTVGQSGPAHLCAFPRGQVQDISPIYSIPFDGVITSFTAGGVMGQQMNLLILQLVSGTTYNVAAKSDAVTFTEPTLSVQTFPTRLTVRAGQLIGNWGGVCAIIDIGASHRVFIGPEPATGANQNFPGTNGDVRIDLSATLELDADRDGFGDETQDRCPTNAATQGPCPQAAAATPKAEDRKCRHLRKKLKRQKAKLEKADTDKKRSMIQANIEDTKRRLEKLGC